MASALYIEGNFPIVVDDNRTHVEAMWCYRGNGDGLAVLLSSLLFGLMHGNVAQIPFAFLVGIALGWLYVATDRIWLSIVVHFANNALSLTLDYLGNHLQPSEQPLFFNWVVLAIGFVGLVA